MQQNYFQILQETQVYFLESKTVFLQLNWSSHVSSTILRWNDGSILSNNAEPFNEI